MIDPSLDPLRDLAAQADHFHFGWGYLLMICAVLLAYVISEWHGRFR